MKKNIFAAALGLILLTGYPAPTSAQENYAFPQHTKYTTGVIKPNHLSQQQFDSYVQSYYDQWKARFIVYADGNAKKKAYVYYNIDGFFDSAWLSVSEGQGYGMLITAFMAGYDPEAQDVFNALYRYCLTYPSRFSPDLMAWQQIKMPDGSIGVEKYSQDSAIDGDLDIAYALLLAHKQWGSDGEVNYKEEAIKRMRAVQDKCVAYDAQTDTYMLKLGDWVDNKQPGDDDPELSDARYTKSFRNSDIMTNHFKVFERFEREHAAQTGSGTEYADKWAAIGASQYKLLEYQMKNTETKNTGLLPDFMVKDEKNNVYKASPPRFLEDPNDGAYNWNSCRVPWRLAMSYILDSDKTWYNELTTINKWIKTTSKGKPENIMAGYAINGQVLRQYEGGKFIDPTTDRAFTAPFIVSGMVNMNNQAWINKLWDNLQTTNPKDDFYFGSNIKMLSLIAATGNWWSPY
jgi:endo-1,4-beta-D-glucanase Y